MFLLPELQAYILSHLDEDDYLTPSQLKPVIDYAKDKKALAENSRERFLYATSTNRYRYYL